MLLYWTELLYSFVFTSEGMRTVGCDKSQWIAEDTSAVSTYQAHPDGRIGLLNGFGCPLRPAFVDSVL